MTALSSAADASASPAQTVETAGSTLAHEGRHRGDRQLTVRGEAHRVYGAGMAGQVEPKLDLPAQDPATFYAPLRGPHPSHSVPGPLLTSSSCVRTPRTSLMRQRPTRWLFPQVASRGSPGWTSQLLSGSLFSLHEIWKSFAFMAARSHAQPGGSSVQREVRRRTARLTVELLPGHRWMASV